MEYFEKLQKHFHKYIIWNFLRGFIVRYYSGNDHFEGIGMLWYHQCGGFLPNLLENTLLRHKGEYFLANFVEVSLIHLCVIFSRIPFISGRTSGRLQISGRTSKQLVRMLGQLVSKYALQKRVLAIIFWI